MKPAATPDTQGQLSVFEKTCAYCGARFRVLATHVPDDPHREEYACPECGKTKVAKQFSKSFAAHGATGQPSFGGGGCCGGSCGCH